VIRAVLLDLDDTLFDHTYAARQALSAVWECHAEFAAVNLDELAHRHGRLLEALHVKVLAGELGLEAARLERFRRLFESAGPPAGDSRVRQAASVYRDHYVQAWREVAGATALLKELGARVRLGIVSNNLSREQRDKLRFCGFDACVDAVVISEEAGVSKPHPAIFHQALDRLDASASESVMVGDSWTMDVVGARAAGMRAIWYNPAGALRPDPALDVQEIRQLEPASLVASFICGSDGWRGVRSTAGQL
jgi:HAD superfamily hydrolase (TIGR01509 family)